MKRFIIALGVLSMIFACDKTNKDQEEEINNNGGGEDNQTAVVEVKSISAQDELSMDVDWAEGRVVVVELTPAEASIVNDVNAKIADESIATCTKELLGIRVKPVSVGETTLTISPKRGPADPKVVKIKINPAGMTQMPVIKSIKLQNSSVELSDLSSSGGMDEIIVPFTYTSDESASIDAFYCSSDDPDVSAIIIGGDDPALKVSVAPNSSNKPTNVRTAKVTLRAFAGPAEPAVLSVDIKGHISFFNVSADPHPEDDGNIHLVKGKSVQLDVYINKTGDLKAGDGKISYTSDSPTRISVDNDGRITIPSSAQVTGAKGNPVSVTVSLNKNYLSPEKLSFRTYEKPTGIKCSIPSGSVAIVKGNSIALTISVLPENAMQDFECDFSGDCATVTRDGNTIKIEGKSSTQYSERIFITPRGGDLLSWYFDVDDYEAADVKAGDYVYYNSSQKRFYFSDAGLRAEGTGWYRFEGGSPKAPDSSYGTLIGIVYNESDLYADQVPSSVLGNGLVTDYGYGAVYRHAGVISIKEDTNKIYSWTGEYFDLGPLWPSGYGGAPTISGNNNTYQINMGIAAYNKNASSAGRKIKAFYSVTEHNQSIFGSSTAEEVIPVGGSTGWLLPSYYEVEHYILPNADIINQSLQKASSLGAQKLSSDRTTYWTASYKDMQSAYCWGTANMGNAYRTNGKYSRLILIL